MPESTAAAVIASGRALMESESDAIRTARERLDEKFARAVQLIADHVERAGGKVIVSGLGKSGFVAQKLAATMCSTGTPAVFLHPVDALHGDIGICGEGDPAIIFSKSGTTAELLRLVPVLRRTGSALIAILGNLASPLAAQADIVLDGSVRAEADPFNLAPTASTAVATAIGDALALSVMQQRKLGHEDFARRHPAGQLGRNLRLTVEQVMHRGDEVAWIAPDSPMRAVIIEMNRCPLGAAVVRSAAGEMLGLITDGDLRRVLSTIEDIRAVVARDLMTKDPVTTTARATLREAMQLMEDRPSQISVLPVVEGTRCTGLVRLHDLYQTELY